MLELISGACICLVCILWWITIKPSYKRYFPLGIQLLYKQTLDKHNYNQIILNFFIILFSFGSISFIIFSDKSSKELKFFLGLIAVFIASALIVRARRRVIGR